EVAPLDAGLAHRRAPHDFQAPRQFAQTRLERWPALVIFGQAGQLTIGADERRPLRISLVSLLFEPVRVNETGRVVVRPVLNGAQKRSLRHGGALARREELTFTLRSCYLSPFYARRPEGSRSQFPTHGTIRIAPQLGSAKRHVAQVAEQQFAQQRL